MNKIAVDLYGRHAEAWDRDRSRDLIERPWLDRFTQPLSPGASILDIGCGTGEPIAHYLLERGFAVTGVDSSPSLIAMARARLPAAEWHVADMRTLDLARRFDALLAWHSFFHLRAADQRPMFARFAAHSRSGAPLMFTSGPEAGEAVGEYRGEPLHHASLSPEEYRHLLRENGFSVLDYRPEDANCGGATIWLARRT
jgi:SAM-dependent methyltransferase